jgi:hypothetical protein
MNRINLKTILEKEQEVFDEKFELEMTGCSECAGSELIDKTQIKYPEGKYHCEYDLEKIKLFLSQSNKRVVEATKKEIIEKIEKHSYLQPDPLFGRNYKEEGHNRGWNTFREVLLAILKDEPLNLVA